MTEQQKIWQKQKEEKIEALRAQAQQYNFTREYSKAMTYYIRAGLLGDLESIRIVCDNLGNGYGMSYDYDELYRCMKIGAKNGVADAMYELGVCYSCGLGTDIDPSEAMHWFSEGAKAGSKAAKRSLRAYNYDFSLEVYKELSPFALAVRDTVFVKEQGLEDEFDDIDAIATHFVVFDGIKPVGTCRLVWDDEIQSYILGRFSVIKEYRKLEVGKDMLDAVVEYAKEEKAKVVSLEATADSKAFFEKYGFMVRNTAENNSDATIWMEREFII